MDFALYELGHSVSQLGRRAFGESLAFVSLALPFWAILVGIGTVSER